ncbi:alpha/beta fold hydrolase [uncultured Imperialibacter sp.]|uniref:alpha/beta fold hydrolase n=1 Tax=uncultured Imperialibacter sp. TaxID=1672639 RepID=UPI0030DB97A9
MKQAPAKYLNYKKYGTGPKYLLAFHGFGQTELAFQLFGTSLGIDYTIISIDLFFHGKSQWPTDELPVPTESWHDLLLGILKAEQIDKFSVMGYSLGGKLALTTAMLFPQRVQRIILAAPDGIYLNPWYNVATGTWVMRAIFHYLNDHPALLIRLISFFSRTRLVSGRLAKFAISQVADHNNGNSIYHAWVGFRHFTQNIDKVLQTVNQNNIHVTMVAGKYDTVIPYGKLHSFEKKCASSDFVLIKTGHNSLLQKFHESLLENVRPHSG